MAQLAENTWFGEIRIPEHMKNRSYNLVSIVGYLLGVRCEMYDRGTLIPSVFEDFQKKPNARTIRALCILRNALLKRYEDISYRLQYDFVNLDGMPDIIDPGEIRFLEEHGIRIIKANHKTASYLLDINRLITDHIQVCQSLFPLWVKWQYIRNLFIMRGGAKEASISEARATYKSNINIYPFHCYVSWPIVDNGNILLHDGKFVPLLYRVNNDRFEDVAKVRDIRQNEKNSLGEFMGAHNRIALLVDCENSDPYKLCAALRNIQNYCPEDIGRIQKIVLYDDVHTVDTWKILGDYVGIPVEYELIERVNNFKSLVDIRMTAGACKEHYQDDIDAFLLASSDSDYWGLISSLPSADFLVLAEYEKCGDSLRGALERAGIFYCFLDDFADNASDIKVDALKSAMKNSLESSLRLNINEMVEGLYMKTRVSMTPAEKKNFFEKYVKTLRLAIANDGTASIAVAE
jgi:hypothetical protein